MIRCAPTCVSTARIIRKEMEEYGIDWHTGMIREDEDGTPIYSIAEAKKDIWKFKWGLHGHIDDNSEEGEE